MHLLHDLVNVNAVALLATTSLLLVGARTGFRSSGFLLAFSASFRRHGDFLSCDLTERCYRMTDQQQGLAFKAVCMDSDHPPIVLFGANTRAQSTPKFPVQFREMKLKKTRNLNDGNFF